MITVSTHAKQEILREYPSMCPNKIAIVPNGVGLEFHPLDKKEVTATVRRYNLAYKDYFMFLSNIEPRKNVDGLLRAYESFLLKNPRSAAKLLLVGGMGWNNESILKKIQQLNKKYKGAIVVPDSYVPDEELPALLSGAAALVHPAHYEGFGISPLQAMACGIQVVVARNTSLPEVVGGGGIYVDENDPGDILRGMELAYNKRGEVNTAGLAAARKYTWKNSAHRLIEVILELEDE